MRLLLDSSGAELVCALANGEGIICERRVPTGTAASRDIGTLAGEVLGELNCAELDRIVVGLGPGSFIGTRVAISYANGLAAAGGVGLCGVDSLAAIAAADGTGERAVLRDARRGEFYVYTPTEPAATRLVALSELGAVLQELGISQVLIERPAPGQKSAQRAHDEALSQLTEASVVVNEVSGVSAEGLRRLSEGELCSYLEPVYLRDFL